MLLLIPIHVCGNEGLNTGDITRVRRIMWFVVYVEVKVIPLEIPVLGPSPTMSIL